MISELMNMLFPEDSEKSGNAPLMRGILLSVIALYSIRFFRTNIRALGEMSSFIHYINLVFHEAGHVIFGFFGNTMLTVLGGSLMQCLVPFVLCIVFFIKNRDAFAAGTGFWWLGQNLTDCAPYINDARSLQLTLIGGQTGREVDAHDWEYILTRIGMLDQDIYIARYVLLTGRIVMIMAMAWCLTDIIRGVMIKRRSQKSDIP